MIEHTSFGSMTIDGHTYTSDLLLLPDGRVIDNWWRRRGHLLQIDDLHLLLEANPDVIVAGTGTQGRMTPQTDLAPFLKAKGVGLIAAPNARAVAVYNQKRDEGALVAACFHLTC